MPTTTLSTSLSASQRQNSTQAIELCHGDPTDESNPFACSRVELNLPGSDGYDPGRPRVRRFHPAGKVAADLTSFLTMCESSVAMKPPRGKLSGK
jgi:hypothetical protein